QCASYCYKVIQPFLQIVHQSQQKDAKIAELMGQLAELQLELTKYKVAESKNKELIEVAESIGDIKILISEIKTGIIQQNQNEQNTKDVIKSGIKMIKLAGYEAFPVPYNNHIAGPGWIIVQQRLNGGQSFFQNWAAYREGFGDLSENGEFF
ncbi:hypothetical protein KR044_012760, partial [Drosophila immigrans]